MSHIVKKNPNLFLNNLLKFEEAQTHFKIDNLTPEQIESLKIPLQPNENKKKFENSSIICIRHALSVANFQHRILDYMKKQPNVNQDYLTYLEHHYIEERLNLENVNCRLHYLGIEQCQNQQKYINEIDFQVIFISPFLRVLQTVEHLFKNHPKLKELKFVVVPQISEGMGFTTSIQQDSKKDLEKFKKNLGIEIDDTLFNSVYNEKFPYFWNYTLLTQDGPKNKALEIKKKSQNYEEFLDNMIQAIKDLAPQKFENKQGQYERGNIAREIIKNYLQKNNIIPTKDKKIAIVSHAVFLHCFNCDYIEDDQYIGGVGAPGNAGLLGFENDLIFDHDNQYYRNLQKQEKNQTNINSNEQLIQTIDQRLKTNNQLEKQQLDQQLQKKKKQNDESQANIV